MRQNLYKAMLWTKDLQKSEKKSTLYSCSNFVRDMSANKTFQKEANPENYTPHPFPQL